MKKDIFVFQDENADYCIIVGTADRAEAEAALRKQEDEWFGPVESRNPNSEIEQPMNMDDFGASPIFVGTKRGEEGIYYWGGEPEAFFDGGVYETEEGFVAALN